MSKIHTKLKRALGIRSTSRKHRFWFTNQPKTKGPKSFKTEESAKAWAQEQKMDTKDLVLYQTHTGKWQWRNKGRE